MPNSPSLVHSLRARSDTWRPPVCNCRMVLERRPNGQVLTVKARAWDCPSCGLDKRRRIATMCAVADPAWLMTFTLRLYEAFDAETGEATMPARHAKCDRYSHVAEYPDEHGIPVPKWRVLESCPHCMAWLSAQFVSWRKRARRVFPGLEYLWARESHKLGSVHVHMAVVGLPKVLSRADRYALRAMWPHGYIDLSKRSAPAGDRVGWYLGKYLAKQQESRVAKGYRRWSRTAGFAPEVLMQERQLQRERAENLEPGGQVLELVGWRHPVSDEVWGRRVWLDEQAT